MSRDIEPAGRLAELEHRIERGLETFVDVGLALLEIRDSRLYRESGYTRFEDYCQERWGWKRAHAYRLIESAQVVGTLSPMGDTPTTERQARELARLKEPEAIREVWHEVREATPEPTARVIREAVERRLNPPQEYVCTECGEVHAARECPNCAEPEPTEREQMARIFAVVGDDDGRIARAALRKSYFTAAHHLRSDLLPLKPDLIASALDPGESDDVRWLIHDCRNWLDRLEAEIQRGLRIVEVRS